PMDCYDACKIEYIDGKCKPSKEKITNGNLCRLFGYLQNEKNLEDRNLDNTLKKVVDKLKEKNQKVLYYKGSGNMGVMQNITKKFFDKIDATFAVGSLCDASGEEGIKMGRKYMLNPHIDRLKEAEVVLVWGRNFTQTSKHIYDLVKDKVFITIDPIVTDIASKSKVHLQIPPKGDFKLTSILIEQLADKKIDIECLEELNISKEQIINTINLLKDKKIAVMLGLGVQKYKEGATIVHHMEKFFNKLGVFNEKNCGVWYLSNSGYPFNNKISISPKKTISYPSVKFDDFDIVFIQGANPIVSAPNTSEIIRGLENTFVIYMGTTYNDTAKYVDIIIPSKTFLQKKDIRLSYSHDEVRYCEICEETSLAISEYELTAYLYKEFNFDGLLNEEEYLDCFKTIVNKKPKVEFKEQSLDDIKEIILNEDEYYLITSKSKNTLNSQFKYNKYAYIHPSLGIKDDEEIVLSSKYGEIKIKVKNNNTIYKRAILIYAGNKQVNYLTSNEISEYGNNAIFQDIKVTIRYNGQIINK
ncbi:MAG: molybdopterin-dependent oxidoreductase, partial [Arcobacteraceae bacterium]|nr:molybdopterin-dependent oxidoreductase [Arcobacteraceae bacterium]